MKQILVLIILCNTILFSNAQNWDSLAKEAAKTEIYEPVPKIVTPGAFNITAPSDAIYLFNGKNLASGFYFAVLQTEKGTKTHKIVLLKQQLCLESCLCLLS